MVRHNVGPPCVTIVGLQNAQIPSDDATLNGTAVRALQLADDLALISTSEAGLQALLDSWARVRKDFDLLSCSYDAQEAQCIKQQLQGNQRRCPALRA